MSCVACGGSNPHEARFCVTCGVPLGSQGDPGPDGAESPGLVPMELGDFLERSLTVYRANFGPFFLIALVAHIPILVLTLVLGGDMQSPEPAETVELSEAIADIRGPLIVTIALALVASYFSTVLSAASVAAVSQYYVDGRVGPEHCFRRAWYRIASLSGSYFVISFALMGAVLAFAGVALLFYLLVGWVFSAVGLESIGAAVGAIGFTALTVFGIVLFFYLLVVWFFIVECIVLERKRPMDSLWRSRELVQGSFWRVFLIGLVFTLLAVGVTFVAGLADLLLSQISTALSSIFFVVVSAVITPFLWIGRTLVYYDLRVRKEQYTMDDLAADMGLSPPPAEAEVEVE